MMQKSLIETLEPRQLLASAASAVIGDTGGVTASAVTAPDIAIAQRTLYFNAVQGTSATMLLRITNNGGSNLDLKPGAVQLLGGDRKSFVVDNFPAAGVSIKPGRRFDLSVTYVAGVSDPLGVKVARLAILSTDPDSPGLTVGLRALTTKGTHDDLEPSLQRVIDTFGLPINVGDDNPDDYLLGTPNAQSDEVVVQSLVKAGSGAVSIRPLAMFGVNSGPAARLGIYSPGDMDSLRELWYVPTESAQSVNPTVYGQTLVDPGNQPFALYTQWPGFFNPNGTARNVYSEDQLNGTWETNSSALRKMRFYPFVDQFGNAAPDTYLVAVEEYTQNYDNQDMLFIISNVKPAAGKPTLAATSVFDQPNNSRLIFNKVQNPDPNYANTTRIAETVVVRNTGTENLVVSFSKTGDFSIASGGGSNITIAPGASRNVVLNFTATSGSGIHNGTFTITSNDPDQATKTYDLVGWWQEYSEFLPDNHGVSLEPSSKQIVNDIFGYTTQLTSGSQNLNTNGRVEATGDEVLSPYWLAADDNAFVRVTQLASFHNQTYTDTDTGTELPTQSYINWYYQGSPESLKLISRHSKGDGQAFLPRENGNNNGIVSNAFKTDGVTPFGFNVEGHEYSDPTLNSTDPGMGHFVRFFPAYDGEGKVIPNTYLVLHDYNREFTNFDFNDNIYLVENIKPVDAIKTPLTTFTEETSKGARISFTSPATGPKIYGFKVYRSSTARGAYDLLTSALTDADGLLPRRPVTTFIDTNSVAADTYFYKIVSVGRNGIESAPVMVQI